MPPRRLSPEERALWQKLAHTVTPLRRTQSPPPPPAALPIPDAPAPAEPGKRIKGRVPPLRAQPPPSVAPRSAPVAVLDGSWEKRIRSGQLTPDHSIDLHGLNLAAAHVRLDRLLGDAVARGWRVLLVVTGKPRPAPEPGDPRPRGAIRAEIGHWLARSPHADRIASVRQAHPRHGGAGALYIILRRAPGA